MLCVLDMQRFLMSERQCDLFENVGDFGTTVGFCINGIATWLFMVILTSLSL